MKDSQLSIYDILEVSQEVSPSETLPQVDEAPSYEDWTEEELNSLEVGFLPSSDLDTQIPTEDTDLPLFSVGDVLTVRQAGDVYSYQNENYDWIKTYQGKSAKIISFDGKSYECEIGKLTQRFYSHELE